MHDFYQRFRVSPRANGTREEALLTLVALLYTEMVFCIRFAGESGPCPLNQVCESLRDSMEIRRYLAVRMSVVSYKLKCKHRSECDWQDADCAQLDDPVLSAAFRSSQYAPRTLLIHFESRYLKIRNSPSSMHDAKTGNIKLSVKPIRSSISSSSSSSESSGLRITSFLISFPRCRIDLGVCMGQVYSDLQIRATLVPCAP